MLDPYQVIKQIYSLSNEDIVSLKERFIPQQFFESKLFLGQFFEQAPTMIIGTCCPRQCIEGISLNTFYQLFMSIKIATKLNLPCKVFLGIKEEIILQPYYAKKFQLLGIQLERGIERLGKKYGVDVQVINTLAPKYDLMIDQCVKDIPIELSPRDSSYLFNLSIRQRPRTLHSSQRVAAEKRAMACNTSYLLMRLFGKQSFLIVEDVEQSGCVLYARRFSSLPFPNMLAFLPLPSIRGTTSMFKAEKDGRVSLLQHRSYYQCIFESSPEWVKEIYKEALSLLDNQPSVSDMIKSLVRISEYFKQ